jgi:thioredoxin-related protein
MNKQLNILATLMLLSLSLQAFGDANPTAVKDWSLTARSARAAHAPVMILYTAHACGYCERLKREVLQPMLQHRSDRHPAWLQEVDINTGGKMIDFDGEPIRSRHFKQRYQVFATPTLLILDSRGEPLTEPIVGYDSQKQYQSRLEELLDEFQI